PPVNAPSQVVLTGTGFSPFSAEDQVTVEGATSQPVVLVAAVDHLVVQLPSGVPEGRHLLTLTISPAGERFHRTLSTARNPLIWKVVTAFWNDPPQAFSGTLVRFRPPKADGGTLYGDLDAELSQQLASNDLDLPAA